MKNFRFHPAGSITAFVAALSIATTTWGWVL